MSVALILNSFLCIIYAIGFLAGIYAGNQKVFEPYLINGNLFWLLIVASILNIFTAIKIIQIQKSYNFQPKSNLGKKMLFWLQLATIFTSFYMFFAVTIYLNQNPAANTLTNLVLAFALLFTGFISFGATVFRTWLK
ncbi:MAG: hypothetical protein ABSA79_11495 [Candidatus Bathyarchaeia archaeon]